MNARRFSNVPDPEQSGARWRARIDRTLDEIDRLLTMPPGHPTTLQMFASGTGRLIVPSTMTRAEADELVRLGREGLADELRASLDELDGREP